MGSILRALLRTLGSQGPGRKLVLAVRQEKKLLIKPLHPELTEWFTTTDGD
ncbi:hypothetical protein WMY93_025766 [Mugilogobius chulae]|uniref:Uncharacterized protein n=1 Tax=Mugilogobius chulae TaxID=88201 RepID=A0AAW0N7F6_9GOBI